MILTLFTNSTKNLWKEMLARIDAACSDPGPHDSMTCLRCGIMLACMSASQFCSVFSVSLKVISDCEEFYNGFRN